MDQVKFQYSNLNLSIIAYSREYRVEVTRTWCSKAFSRQHNHLTMLPSICKVLMAVDHPLGTTARGLSMLKLILRRQLCTRTVRITCRLPCPTTRETQVEQVERQLFTGDMVAKCIIPRRITLPWEPWRSCRPEMLRGLWTSTPSRLPISMAAAPAITGSKWAESGPINMISIMAVNSTAYLNDTCSTDKMEISQARQRLSTELRKATS